MTRKRGAEHRCGILFRHCEHGGERQQYPNSQLAIHRYSSMERGNPSLGLRFAAPLDVGNMAKTGSTAQVIRIDAVWLGVEPLDMRAGTEAHRRESYTSSALRTRTTPASSPIAISSGQAPICLAVCSRHRSMSAGSMTSPGLTAGTITRDSVTIKVNAVLWYWIVDAAKSAIEVADAHTAVYQLALTGLRIGQHDLDEVLQEP